MGLKKSWRIFFLTKSEIKILKVARILPGKKKKHTTEKKRACKLNTSSFFSSHIFTNVLKLFTSLKKRLCTTIYCEKKWFKEKQIPKNSQRILFLSQCGDHPSPREGKKNGKKACKLSTSCNLSFRQIYLQDF